MDSFVFVPYVGALPITFEMLPTDVERLEGPADRVQQNYLSERDEVREVFMVRYSQVDQKVVEIAFHPSASLLYGGTDLFRCHDAIGVLSQHDQPYEHLGFIVFLGVGITLTGFHDKDESQKAITVFRKGRWDFAQSELVPFTWPRPT